MPIQDSVAVLTPTLRGRFRHTAICVFEKNYRLQDIQLSKNKTWTQRPEAYEIWWRIPGSNR